MLRHIAFDLQKITHGSPETWSCIGSRQIISFLSTYFDENAKARKVSSSRRSMSEEKPDDYSSEENRTRSQSRKFDRGSESNRHPQKSFFKDFNQNNKKQPAPAGVKTIQAKGFAEKKDRSYVKQNAVVSEPEDKNRPKTALEVVREIRRKAAEPEAADEPEILEDSAEKEAKLLSSEKKKPHYPPSSPAGRAKGRTSDKDVFDTKGFKTYRHLIPDYDRMTADDVIAMLKKRIVYNEHDIVAIDKPYGLPVHGGPTVHHNLARYLPELARWLVKDGSVPNLHLVNRIDKETSGVVLLGRTPESAAKLHDMFLTHTVKKIYWAVTIATPEPFEGVIDIPIGDSDATGSHRRVLRPARTESTNLILKKTGNTGKRAVTNYKVLGTSGGGALVELSPRTGVQHQVRLHLAYGMSCPILGDHKYSHFTKLAPQKLPKDMLLKLKMRQAKVRTLPMLLHAKTLILPEYNESGNVIISAEVPWYFRQIMSALKIKVGDFDRRKMFENVRSSIK